MRWLCSYCRCFSSSSASLGGSFGSPPNSPKSSKGTRGRRPARSTDDRRQTERLQAILQTQRIGRWPVRCHAPAGCSRTGSAKHQATWDAKGHAKSDSQGYVLKDGTPCGPETQTQTHADNDVLHKSLELSVPHSFDRANVIHAGRPPCFATCSAAFARMVTAGLFEHDVESIHREQTHRSGSEGGS